MSGWVVPSGIEGCVDVSVAVPSRIERCGLEVVISPHAPVMLKLDAFATCANSIILNL